MCVCVQRDEKHDLLKMSDEVVSLANIFVVVVFGSYFLSLLVIYDYFVVYGASTNESYEI